MNRVRTLDRVRQLVALARVGADGDPSRVREACNSLEKACDLMKELAAKEEPVEKEARPAGPKRSRTLDKAEAAAVAIGQDVARAAADGALTALDGALRRALGVRPNGRGS